MNDPTGEYSVDYSFKPRPYRHFAQILDDIKGAFVRRAIEFNFRVSQICPVYGSGELVDHIIGVRVVGHPFESTSNPNVTNHPLLPPEELVAALLTRSLQDLVNREPTREDRMRKIEEFANSDPGESAGPQTALTPDHPDIRDKTIRVTEPTGLTSLIDVSRGRLSIDNVWVSLDDQLAEILARHLKRFRFAPVPGKKSSRKRLNLQETEEFLDTLSIAVAAAQHHLEDPLAVEP